MHHGVAIDLVWNFRGFVPQGALGTIITPTQGENRGYEMLGLQVCSGAARTGARTCSIFPSYINNSSAEMTDFDSSPVSRVSAPGGIGFPSGYFFIAAYTASTCAACLGSCLE